MWFPRPEQKQRCQQSSWCLSCSLSKGNFSVFTNIHMHNSFFPQHIHHCQEKLTTDHQPSLPDIFFFFLFPQVSLSDLQPKWLSVSLFRSISLSALRRLCLSCLSCLGATSDCFYLEYISFFPFFVPFLPCAAEPRHSTAGEIPQYHTEACKWSQP